MRKTETQLVFTYQDFLRGETAAEETEGELG
jgi:hypothetical protein